MRNNLLFSFLVISSSFGQFSQQAKLTASDAAAGNEFGAGVSTDGSYLISSAYQEYPNSVANEN